MTYPLVSIIVVTYNSAQYIKSCLDTLLKITYPRKEVIVVDNNSTDETQNIVSEYKNKINVFYTGKNLGYAEGNNFGIRHSKGAYIFLINPDTKVEESFLEPLVRVMEGDGLVGVCQPLVRLMADREKINLTGKVTHYLGFDWIRGYQDKKPPPLGEIGSFSGCGVLLRKKLLDEIGAYDPLYFMYYEDTDLSWRMRLSGYKIIFVPESVIYHDYKYIPNESYQSLKSKVYYNDRNRLITFLKNYSLKSQLILLPSLLLLEISMLFYTLLRGWIGEKFRGYFFILKNWGNINKGRQAAQQVRRIEDNELFKDMQATLTFGFFLNPFVQYLINPLLWVYYKTAKKII